MGVTNVVCEREAPPATGGYTTCVCMFVFGRALRAVGQASPGSVAFRLRVIDRTEYYISPSNRSLYTFFRYMANAHRI